MMTDAQKTLVEENMGVVYAVINRKFPWLMQDEDATSSGYLGLCKAAQTFDSERQIAFSTYAWPCIYNEIAMYLRGQQKFREHEAHLEFDTDEKSDGEGSFLDVLGKEDERFEHFELSEDVKKAISELPECRQKTINYFLNGKSFAQVAREQKITRQGAQVNFQRAARELAERLNGGYG